MSRLVGWDLLLAKGTRDAGVPGCPSWCSVQQGFTLAWRTAGRAMEAARRLLPYP